ncbi:hypothetical protein MFRU_007g02070 [Monilinia fructicola]|uniref:2EXR domain-containing protein n=1 Tax=Monilinia fructicola TaxID=38448 RepID=A0A5M9JEM4_MONFR|nr:hypothetical protein EYC84_010169 [Monilinia fructicola]KAG4032299.1 hypothetical protein MFRU_007g02070 [Monilinia fructicola]
MVLTRQGAKLLLEAASQSPPPPPSDAQPFSTFHLFSDLCLDLKTMIWEAAEALHPGHVIEVCNRPSHYNIDGTPISFEWYAVPCGCEKRCYEPALLSVNRESRAIIRKKMSWCFGTWVNWNKDIIFIGDRVGHLHNTGFLQALESQGCRDKLKTLAIDYECWENSVGYPCGGIVQCNPATIILQLPQIKRLIFTQHAGIWRDGNETKYHQPNYCKNNYRHANNVDHPDFNALAQSQHEDFCKWMSQNIDGQKDFFKFPDLPAEKKDMWRCNSEDARQLCEGMLGSYKHVKSLSDEREYGVNGDCGVALVQFDKIEGGYWWNPPDDIEDESEYDRDLSFLEDSIQAEFNKLKPNSRNGALEDSGSTSWKIPEITYALVRRTAPSCSTDDWEGLEKDFMIYNEACWANQFTENYELRDKSKDYPPGQHIEDFVELYREAGLPISSDG